MTIELQKSPPKTTEAAARVLVVDDERSMRELLSIVLRRDGYEVLVNDVGAGWVTTGGPSPTLNKNIGMCYLPCAKAEAGRSIQIEAGHKIQVLVRGQAVDAVTVPTPFYRRTS